MTADGRRRKADGKSRMADSQSPSAIRHSLFDVVVVGAGLAGMFAGALAARRGARTLVVARGVGGTHVGPGTIDVWGYGPHPPAPFAKHPFGAPVGPSTSQLLRLRSGCGSAQGAQQERGSVSRSRLRSDRLRVSRPGKEATEVATTSRFRDRLSLPVTNPESELEKLETPQHPLTLAGLPALREALAELQRICEDAGYPLAGALDRNFLLPTALGAIRPTCLAPESFVAGDVRQPGELTLARLPGFRDFFADLAAANLCAAGYPARALTLELPHAPARRDSYATDLARLFDDANYRAEIANRWRDSLTGVTRLGLPAILGLENAAAARRDLCDKLGVELFEIPILPPSVPGMRLFNILRETIHDAGGRVTIGPRVAGWVEKGDAGRGKKKTGRAVGVIAETAGGPREYSSRFIILATGGFRHGGLEAPAKGQIRETVFDLPAAMSDEWFAPLYWDAHPYARFGVRVNENMQPVDAKGKMIYPNLFAVGGLLAGADRLTEGSREGIDLATAWQAAKGLVTDH
jgi:glycerol-3-phosphate dehydrogenase subunit B